MSKLCVLTVFSGVLTLLVGCGSGAEQMQTAKVSGKVTFEGSPVTGGELLFAPQAGGGKEAGKPGAAKIQADGTFTASTYGNGDGAVVGSHTLTYIAPPPKSNQVSPSSSGQPSPPAEKPMPSPYEGLVPEQSTVQVSDGENDLTITLKKK